LQLLLACSGGGILTSRKQIVRRGTLAALALGLAAAGYAFAAGSAVTLTVTGPQPPTVTVNWGDTVTWTNADTAQATVTFKRDGVKSGPIAPGGAYARIFDGHSGIYAYNQIATKTSPGRVVLNVTGTVTLTADRVGIAYGQRTTLHGSSTFAGSPVVIQRRLLGQRSWAPFQTVATDVDGSYTLDIKPGTGAEYRADAAAGQIQSVPVEIRVRPVVSIRVVPRVARTGHTLSVDGTISPASAAASLALMRYSQSRAQWRPVAVSPLKSGRASFHYVVGQGRALLRTWILQRSVHPGYVVSWSPQVTVTGLGAPPAPPHHKHKQTKKTTKKKKKTQ
jgi:plastocyanin